MSRRTLIQTRRHWDAMFDGFSVEQEQPCKLGCQGLSSERKNTSAQGERKTPRTLRENPMVTQWVVMVTDSEGSVCLCSWLTSTDLQFSALVLDARVHVITFPVRPAVPPGVSQVRGRHYIPVARLQRQHVASGGGGSTSHVKSKSGDWWPWQRGSPIRKREACPFFTGRLCGRSCSALMRDPGK